MEKIFNIIDAVNTLDNSIEIAREKGFVTPVNIDITRLENECIVTVHGIKNNGSAYSSLELHVKDGIVYWEQIPVGYCKDLLPNSFILHNEK